MSVLAGQHVLIIGDETTQVHDIESALRNEGAQIYTTTCAETSPDLIEKQQIDVIFINHLHKKSHCVDLLTQIKLNHDVKVLPIFALVHDSHEDIEHALSLGAADYFTPKETVKSILNKVRIVLGDTVNSADNTVIDIGKSHIDTEASGTKVLIVEDDPLLANLLSIRFEKAKFPYLVNSDGKNVISDIQSFAVDVVILDLMLPGTSGFDILADIRAHDTYKDLPVFIFSNRDSDEDKKRAHELGVAGFYVKAMTDLSEIIKGIEASVQKVEAQKK
jgi:DNA-binding response OmpR family regulator